MKSRLHANALTIFSLLLLLFAFCLSSTVASAAPAYVQQCSSTYTWGTSASCTLSGVGAGHALLIGVYTQSGATPTVTSSSGTPTSVISNLADYQGAMNAFILANTAAGSITITATTTTGTSTWVSVTEYSGVTTSPLDTSATASEIGGWDAPSVSTGNFTTTAASDMLWSMCYGIASYVSWYAGTVPITWTAVNSYSSSGLFVEDGLAGSAGTYYGQCASTTTNGGAELASIMTVALKAAPTTPAATPTFNPASGTYTSPQTVTISDTTSGSTIYYTTNGTTPSTASSVYSSPLPVASSQTVEAVAIASGYSLSAVGSAAYTINLPAAATPTFNPAAGTYASAQAVTISDSTSGSTIYYTTNGITPTTASSVYSSAVTVSANETLEAIAIASGYSLSAVGSAAYAIEAATPTFSPAAGTYTSAQTVTISDGTSGATIYYTTNGTTPTTSSTKYSSAITVSVNETLEAIATASGYTQSPVGSAAYAIQAATPAFSPAAGTYASAQTVTITDGTSGATIYYTTNGSTPTTSSTVYSSAITVSVNETLKAVALASGYMLSPVGSAAYTIEAATPTFSPAAGTYTSIQTVTISDGTSGATIYYTTNGTTPTTASSVYNSPVTVGATQTLEAIALASGYTQSPVGSAAYTINLPAAATPTFNPAAGTYSSAQTVTISDGTSGATIYYTTNGSTPTTSSSVYNSPIAVSASETLKAIATATGYSQSAVGSAAYTISLPPAATPTFNPAAGTYSSAQTVTISDGTSGATIYYTTNGTTPTTSSTVYSSPVTVSATETLEAIATASGYTQSAVGSAAYTITPPAATPTFNPAAGTYSSAQTVTISDGTSGATIYYTTNGTTPTTSSSVYSSAITVSVNETVEAVAIASGYSLSAVGSAAYAIEAATPTFNPAAGTYSSAQTVTISDGTSGATIYYTTNGTTPTTSSSVYNTPITVSATETLEAIAIASGYSQSPLASAVYTISSSSGPPAYVQQCSSYGGYVETVSCTLSGVGAGHSLMIGVYVSGTTTPTITSSSGTPSSVISNLADYQGEMDAALLANTASGSITITATTSVYTNMWISVTEYSGVATAPLDTSATASLVGGWDATSVSTGNFTTAAASDMLWSMCYGIPSYVGWYAGTVPITWTAVNSYSASGLFVEDGLAGTAGTYYGQCVSTTTNGGAEQASIMTVALKAGSSAPVAATPTFNPAAGTYTSPQTVTISDTTSGSTIYYTTNGTTPSTASNVYSSPLPVSTSQTIEAVAIASGYSLSAVGSAAYTINLPAAATPTFNPAAGTYSSAQSVTISDTTSGATIYYTTNGTTPTTNSNVYSSAINVSASETLEAIAIASGYSQSAVGSAAYTINLPVVATPTFSPAAGTFASAQTVTISDGTSGATIYYTTNGTTPTTASSVYSSAITVSATETLEAIATHSGYTNSAVGSAAYTINGAAATPTFNPAAGTYTSVQTVTISDGTSGATIYYTTNGTTPTTNSTVYSSAITVSVSETLEAIATASGYTQSAVGSAAYTINLTVATPTFNPGGGNYSSAQTVTISDSTSGSTIYYTTNGTTPTTGSNVYSSPITVSATETLEAIATHSGYAQSAVGSAAYTIGASSGAIYTVQHNSGSNESATSLAVAFTNNVTSGNVLLVAESTYDAETLDTPTDSQGNSFTQLVNAGTSGDSVAAIYAATAKSSGADTVTCNISASNNIHCHIYEVHGITTTMDQTGNSTQTSTSLTVSTSASTSNADDYVFAFFTDNANGATLTAGPGLGDTELSNDGGDSAFSEDKVVIATGVQTATATSNLDDADVNVIVALKTTGTPTVSTPTFSPGTGTYISIQAVTISDWTSGSAIYYTTNGTTPTTSSAVYSSPITVSTTQTVEAIATSTGFANSSVGSATYTINLPAATPTFNPPGGSYSSAQTVTISDGTSGATIYYTTNGFTPTTASTVYTRPINVSVWETLQAIAIAPGASQSAVGVASYTIGNGEAAAPTFSPGAGDYDASQTVTLSDGTAGATIYFTTNGSTPTTSSTRYTGAITVSTSETLEAIATASGYTQSGVSTAEYTINTTSGACDGMSVGSSVAGTANMNGFLPFQSATGMTTLWNTNIANAAIDPNNATIQSTAGYSGESTHINFGSSPSDGGIPFMIVDSGTTPTVSINVIDYANQSDVVVAPYPSNVPIEGAAADCSGWPDTYQSDSHTNVLDRNTCWDYETYNTNRCNGLYDASEEVIWDMQNGEMRPWGWTSTDAAGLSVMAGLLKYDEAASGTIKHAIRFTMQQSKNDANAGYFVEPASHAAGTSYGAPTVEGMRVRLKSSFNISGYSAINQAILTALQQYGMIMADNGGYFFIQGATDSRWNDSDLANLAGIPSSDFDVIQMTPEYPGWDSVTAPTGSAPVINSFTSSLQTVSAGTPVTFNFSVSGDSYDYIDMIGPVRLTSGSGSVTIAPTITQTYTLYSVNQYGNNGAGEGYGIAVSNPITIVVPGSVVVPPTFTPSGGTYSAAQVVTFNTTTYPYATFYYTTDGSTPTYPPTGTTKEYPVIPQPMSPQSVGALESITVSASETIKAIAVAPGYASPSAVSSATYVIN
jgi:ribosome-binding factor A